jgi:hypothetical protein
MWLILIQNNVILHTFSSLHYSESSLCRGIPPTRHTLWSPHMPDCTAASDGSPLPVGAFRVEAACLGAGACESQPAYHLNNIYKFSSYLTGNTSRLHYKAQPVNAVCGNSRCLLWEPYGTHSYTVWAECRVCTSQETHHVSTTKPNRLMLFGETVADYCENHIEHTDILCVQNVEFWEVKLVGTYSNHCT